MFEQAIKRGGASFIRILLQQTSTIRGGFTGLPVESRLKLKYKIKDFENGKLANRLSVNNIAEGFTPFKLN